MSSIQPGSHDAPRRAKQGQQQLLLTIMTHTECLNLDAMLAMRNNSNHATAAAQAAVYTTYTTSMLFVLPS